MRLVTWNCGAGALEKKLPHLEELAADVCVLQECSAPRAPVKRARWAGDRGKKGVALVASGEWRIRSRRVRASVPNYIVPFDVDGPASFTVLAVWSKPHRRFPYVEGIHEAVRIYRTLIASRPTAVLGDFNSNPIWDHQHRPGWSHSALVSRLGDLGLVSAYHEFHGETPGQETRATYFHQWNRKQPFHIDYCFVPSAWIPRLRRVDVGDFQSWKRRSDHRPLVVDLAD
jgi:exonuclease III